MHLDLHALYVPLVSCIHRLYNYISPQPYTFGHNISPIQTLLQNQLLCDGLLQGFQVWNDVSWTYRLAIETTSGCS